MNGLIDWFDDLSLVAARGGIAADPPKLLRHAHPRLPYRPKHYAEGSSGCINKH
jgi:hypothetical protein